MTRYGYLKSFRGVPALLVAASLTATNAAMAADKTMTVSGDSVPSDCGSAKSANGASMMTGSLEGCLAYFIMHSNCRAMNGFDLYVELGREEFEGKLEGAATKFDTIYTGTQILPLGSCTTPPAPEKEIVGGCTHNVSGDGIQGVIRFYDVIPTVGKGASNFFYEGVLTLRNGKSAAIAPVVPEPHQAAEAGSGASQRQLGLAPMAC